MPATKKLTATCPDGTTVTRKTARTYTHVVVARRNEVTARADANSAEAQARDAASWDQQSQRAQGQDLHSIGFLTAEKQAEYDQEQIAMGKAFLAENPDRAAFVASQHAARVAKVDAAKAAGHYDTFVALTWAGRPDLAQKALASVSGRHVCDVTLVPVNS